MAALPVLGVQLVRCRRKALGGVKVVEVVDVDRWGEVVGYRVGGGGRGVFVGGEEGSLKGCCQFYILGCGVVEESEEFSRDRNSRHSRYGPNEGVGHVIACFVN